MSDHVIGPGHSQADGGVFGADAAPGDFGHPRQDLLQRDRPREAAAQVGQGLVRRGRRPYTARSPNRCTPRRSGWNASATSAVATPDAQYSPDTRSPTSAPSKTTAMTYPTVTKMTTAPPTTARLMTRSMSYRR